MVRDLHVVDDVLAFRHLLPAGAGLQRGLGLRLVLLLLLHRHHDRGAAAAEGQAQHQGKHLGGLLRLALPLPVLRAAGNGELEHCHVIDH